MQLFFTCTHYTQYTQFKSIKQCIFTNKSQTAIKLFEAKVNQKVNNFFYYELKCNYQQIKVVRQTETLQNYLQKKLN